MIDRTKCTSCGQTKTDENTSKDRSKPDGFKTRCRACVQKAKLNRRLPAVVDEKPRCGLVELVPDDKPQIYCRGDELFTTSLDVARKFGKRHDAVLRDIDDKNHDSPEKHLHNFVEIFVPDSYGRQQRAFELTRDAFSILVMGFTGADALAWKWKYIEAFNAMEQEIKRGMALNAQLIIQMQATQERLARSFEQQTELMKSIDQSTSTGFKQVNTRLDDHENKINAMGDKINRMGKKEISAKTRKLHASILMKFYGGKCPCCPDQNNANQIIDPHGVTIPRCSNADHYGDTGEAGVTHTWLLCLQCHDHKTNGRWPHSYIESQFRSYQEKVRMYRDLFPRQISMAEVVPLNHNRQVISHV